MKSREINSILSDYPKMTCSAIIECGWYELIRDMLSEMQDYVTKNSLGDDVVTIDQIKEKFGTLRVYLDVNPGDKDTDDPVFMKHWKAFYDIVRKYEVLSATVCEDCNASGAALRSGGWVRTLCDNCHRSNRR